jgi:hypothetical protein
LDVNIPHEHGKPVGSAAPRMRCEDFSRIIALSATSGFTAPIVPGNPSACNVPLLFRDVTMIDPLTGWSSKILLIVKLPLGPQT